MSNGIESIVERNLEAYNRHDLDAFMACFAPTAWIEDGLGNNMAADFAAIRARYEKRFGEHPNLRSTILNRIVVGQYVIDDEHLTGFADGSEQHVVLVYRIEQNAIAFVRFLA
jgi:hypothetical protein